ncbi:WalW protein, partial [Escherichia coli]|nr:WalW protein [Escherichia coli]
AAGVPLTYLVDYPIATSPLAVDVLREVLKDGRSAIGTQLHPWVNPPHLEDVNGFNSFTGNLPIDLQRAKLTALTDAVERAFGRRPLVYRAGRYGIG